MAVTPWLEACVANGPRHGRSSEAIRHFKLNWINCLEKIYLQSCKAVNCRLILCIWFTMNSLLRKLCKPAKNFSWRKNACRLKIKDLIGDQPCKISGFRRASNEQRNSPTSHKCMLYKNSTRRIHQLGGSSTSKVI